MTDTTVERLWNVALYLMKEGSSLTTARNWQTGQDIGALLDRLQRAEADLASLEESTCENGHHLHSECSEACRCWGADKSRIDRAEADAAALREALTDAVQTVATGRIGRAGGPPFRSPQIFVSQIERWRALAETQP